jgi:hypothetical protein
VVGAPPGSIVACSVALEDPTSLAVSLSATTAGATASVVNVSGGPTAVSSALLRTSRQNVYVAPGRSPVASTSADSFLPLVLVVGVALPCVHSLVEAL